MATAAGFSFDQSFNSDDDDTPQQFVHGANASIFLLDCSQSMFQEFVEDEEATSLFLKCLSVLERFLLNKIISNNKYLVSF
jgi:Ku70/Ku80 N-terminal alpha/beta domain